MADLPDAAQLAKTWEGLDTDGRRRLLQSALNAVILHRGRVPIDERAEIVFRGGELPAGYEQRGRYLTVDFEAVARQMRETRSAVAPTYERILRERHPSTAWEAGS